MLPLGDRNVVRCTTGEARATVPVCPETVVNVDVVEAVVATLDAELAAAEEEAVLDAPPVTVTVLVEPPHPASATAATTSPETALFTECSLAEYPDRVGSTA
jgi:hypothetical protein